MKRILKFRIWDYAAEAFVDDGVGQVIYECCYDGEVEYQQYTGLKDKNGVEIYEGDIVKAFTCNDDTEFYAPVVFCPHRGYYLDSEIERYDRIVYDGGVCLGPSCEVIGNIFENPELLK